MTYNDTGENPGKNLSGLPYPFTNRTGGNKNEKFVNGSVNVKKLYGV